MRPVSITLGWSLAVALASAGMAAKPASTPAQSAPAPSASAGTLLQVNTGRGRLITLTRPMSDVFVADEKIADVQARSPTQLYVFGKAAGETTLSVTNKAGAVVYAATVRVGNNFDSIQNMLALAMPNARIVATPMNGLVLLTGTVANPEDGAEATRLVQAYVGDQTKVLSRLGTATPLQVNLQVRIAEVTRSFIKNIGVNVTSYDGSSGFKFGVAQGRGAATQYAPFGGLFTGGTQPSEGQSLLTNATNATTIGAAGKLFGFNLISALDLGERDGQVTTLANPNMTVISGETSSFLAGGEFPIPVVQQLGAITIEFKQYGISLSYTPTVLADGRISLRVRPEVSQLSSQGSVTIAGTNVPALTTRRVETTVELGSGQSMMIAGLLSNNHDNSINKAPGLGDVPVLGALFRSTAFQRSETELVIVITPYLVKPVNGNDIALPTDGYKAPSDVDRLLFGQLGGGKTGQERPKPRVAPEKDPQPTLGATSTAPSTPAPEPSSPADKRREEAFAAPAKTKKSKRGPSAGPGFSIN